MEKFSVLISVYYKEKGQNLKDALNSIFKQSIFPFEVVLVKDGPLTDELNAIIKDFANKYSILKVIELPENLGLGKALNAGLKECSYELVARMDSDDLSLPERFEKQLKAFSQYPQASIVGGWISEFEDDPNKIIAYRKVPERNKDLQKYFRSKSPLNHVTVMFKKSKIIEAGGYQHFYLLEDYWLWARLIKNGAKLYNVQDVLVNVRGGTVMAARRSGFKYAKSEISLQRKMLSMNLINYYEFCRNVCVRFTVRLLPNFIRNYIYIKILR